MKDDKYVVLCVDDDPDFLESMKIFLEANDYIVVTASTGGGGFDEFKKSRPDLIIADMMMEEPDAGIRLARELKLNGNRAPVFILSSVGDHLNSTLDLQETGVSGIFQKPFKPAVLSSIRAALEQ